MLSLAATSYGQAAQQAARLGALATAWNTAGRPGTDHLRIAAYPAGAASPDTARASTGRPTPPSPYRPCGALPDEDGAMKTGWMPPAAAKP